MIQLNLILSNYHWLFITYTPLHSKEDTQGLSQRWAQHNMATANDQQLKLIVNGIKYVLPLNWRTEVHQPLWGQYRCISAYFVLVPKRCEKAFFFNMIQWEANELCNLMNSATPLNMYWVSIVWNCLTCNSHAQRHHSSQLRTPVLLVNHPQGNHQCPPYHQDM